MKKNKNKYILIVLVIVVIILAVLVVVTNKNKIAVDDPLVTTLYTYLGSNDLEMCNGLLTYSDNTINYDSIEPVTRICMAYSILDSEETTTMKIDKTKKNNTCTVGENITFATDNYEDDICTITKIDASKINEIYQEMYGEEIESYDTFTLNNTTICYYEENNYYCGLSESFTYSIGAEPHTFRSIKKVEEKKDSIIIYDYFLKVVDDVCYSNYNGSIKNDKCSEKYEEGKVDYNFLKKYATLYKHTYQKDGDSYHWVKSEPVK